MPSQRTKTWMSKVLGVVFGFVFLIGSFYQINGMFQTTPEQRIGQAEYQKNAGEYDKALASLAEARKQTPTDGRIYLLEGEVYRAQQKWQQAYDSLKTGEHYGSGNPLLYQMLAMTALELKKPQEAEAAFEKAAQLAPTDGMSYNNLGVYYVQNGKKKQAREAFDKGIKGNPAFPDLYLSRGILNQSEGKNTQASQDFVKYLQLEPQAAERSKLEDWLAQHPAPQLAETSATPSPAAKSAKP